MMVLGLLFTLAGPAAALIVAPPPPMPQRVAEADAIVVGRIVSLEEKTVSAQPYARAPQETVYRVAVLKIQQSIKGKHGATLRLAFPAPPDPSGGEIIIKPRGPQFGLAFKIGQEGLYYLNLHFKHNFYLAPTYYSFVSKDKLAYSQEVELTRLAMKLGKNLAAGLEAKDRNERFYAATLLIQTYRTFRGGSGKTELLDRDESKRILTALAEADWNGKGPITPWSLFNQLGLTEKDGWTLPAHSTSVAEIRAAARTWLRENAGTYLIRRIVNDNQATK
jgi:hypothetical protein